MTDQLRSIYDLTLLVQQLCVDRMAEAHRELGGPPSSKHPDPSIEVWAPRREPTGSGVAVEEAKFWLDHCARLSGRMSDFDHETRRGYTIACKLLGLGWDNTQRAIGAARTSGVEAAAAVWAPYMSTPDHRYVALVYVARYEVDRGIWKVGFTTDLPKRLKSLSRHNGGKIIAVSAVPGTMLDEWALHMDLGRCIKPEWYPAEAIPSWLLGPTAPEAA
jgi:hypothetical protein